MARLYPAGRVHICLALPVASGLWLFHVQVHRQFLRLIPDAANTVLDHGGRPGAGLVGRSNVEADTINASTTSSSGIQRRGISLTEAQYEEVQKRGRKLMCLFDDASGDSIPADLRTAYTKYDQIDEDGWRECPPEVKELHWEGIQGALKRIKAPRKVDDHSWTSRRWSHWSHKKDFSVLPSGAYHLSVYNPDHRVIVSMDSRSPAHATNPPHEPGRIISHWSDITFLTWQHLYGGDSKARDLKYIIRGPVLTDITELVIERVVQPDEQSDHEIGEHDEGDHHKSDHGMTGHDKRGDSKDDEDVDMSEATESSGGPVPVDEWPGHTFEPGSPEFVALLGTPHGNGVGLLLIQHKAELGATRAVKSIRVWDAEEPNLRYQMMFKIG